MTKDSSTPTQEHLPIAGAQDSVVIMNDGSVRAILAVEPINFELKSEQEQNSTIYGYQSFLNSLEFPIQIVIQSKKLDLERYLSRMQEYQKITNNDLLRIQIEDYVGFVRQLINIANIMSKKFFVVVSYSSITKQKPSSLLNVFSKQNTGAILDQEQFTRFRGEALNRANLVGNGLLRLGLKVSLLDTQKLIELFYGLYNPDIATEERITDLEAITGNSISSLMSAQNNGDENSVDQNPPEINSHPTQPAQ